ncbi:hypothetical protein [Tellurirhabdus bombi]|uniref:hypothetical protein n=1 Tax=Tellurirhabdus bombi TaxID=2907205 RepID=UPI001F36B4BA|nr:hypothetical protein [Tellurirhabdus bombi]
MIKQLKWFVPALFVAALSSCETSDSVVEPGPGDTLINSDFKTSLEDWKVGYADFSAVHQDTVADFKHELKALPAPLDTTKKSLMVSGYNRSDDLFMYLKKRVTGLRPNTDYKLAFEVEFASNYPTNSFGVGGSPGSSVYVKVGASGTEPKKVRENDDHYRMNIDKGNQASDGKDMITIGNVGAGDDVEVYTLVKRNNLEKPFTAKTNANGELWVIVGTDSGFEAQSVFYYNKITVKLL